MTRREDLPRTYGQVLDRTRFLVAEAAKLQTIAAHLAKGAPRQTVIRELRKIAGELEADAVKMNMEFTDAKYRAHVCLTGECFGVTQEGHTKRPDHVDAAK